MRQSCRVYCPQAHAQHAHRGHPLSNNSVHKNSVVDQIMKSVQVLLLLWLLTSDKNFIDIALALDSNLHKYPSSFLPLPPLLPLSGPGHFHLENLLT